MKLRNKRLDTLMKIESLVYATILKLEHEIFELRKIHKMILNERLKMIKREEK